MQQPLEQMSTPCPAMPAPFFDFPIRRHAKRDNPAVLAILRQPRCRFFGVTLEPFGSAAEVQAWIESRGSARYDIVATRDDIAVGFAGLHVRPGRQNHVGDINVVVHDAVQRRGIGTALLKVLTASADLFAGLRRLQLEVYCDNEPAIALYRRFGFETEGLCRSFMQRDDAVVDMLVMARLNPRLADASAEESLLARVNRPFRPHR